MPEITEQDQAAFAAWLEARDVRGIGYSSLAMAALEWATLRERAAAAEREAETVERCARIVEAMGLRQAADAIRGSVAAQVASVREAEARREALEWAAKQCEESAAKHAGNAEFCTSAVSVFGFRMAQSSAIDLAAIIRKGPQP